MVNDKNKQNNKAQQQNNAQQQNGGGQQQVKDPNAPAQKVVEAAQQNYAIQHGGQLPQTNFVGAKQTVGWTPDGKPIESGGNAQPMAQPMDFFGQGGGIQGKYDQKPPVASQPQQQGGKQEPYMGDMADKTPQAQTNFEGFQAPQFKPEVQPQQQGDLSSLSQALANAGGNPRQAQFQADPSQRDGGFFSWLGGLIPKKRPGLREGETPDEYDARMTRNTKMYFTLADALRHLGNIVNTSKYAPLQQFNDPNAMIEQQYQQRRAERQKQKALDAVAAYKQANMDLKARAQQAADAYKQMQLQLGLDRFKYQMGKDANDFDYKQKRDAAADAYKDRKFNADQQQRATSNSLRAASIAKRGSGGGRAGKGGSGSGGKYWFIDKNGKTRYQPNKTMWEQEYYREYGNLPQAESNTSTSSKTYDKNGEHTTTTRKKGPSMTSQAAQQQNAAQKARKNQNARKGSKLKNTSALGL